MVNLLSVGGVRVAGGPCLAGDDGLPDSATPDAPHRQVLLHIPRELREEDRLAAPVTSSVSAGTPPYTYDWNFGDDSSGLIRRGSNHEFTSLHGGAPVTLVVTDANGTGANYSTPLGTQGSPFPARFRCSSP